MLWSGLGSVLLQNPGEKASQAKLPQEQGINPTSASGRWHQGCTTSPDCGFVMELSPRAMGTSVRGQKCEFTL